MSDEEKVAAPAFEKMQAGVGGISSSDLTTDWENSSSSGPTPQTTKAYRLITKIIDDKDSLGELREEEKYNQAETAFRQAAQFGASAHASLRHTGRAKFGAEPIAITAEDTHYEFATTDTFEVVDTTKLTARIRENVRQQFERRFNQPSAKTYVGATHLLKDYLREVPSDKGMYQVVAQHEID